MPEGLTHEIILGSLALIQLQVLLMDSTLKNAQDPQNINEKVLQSMERIETNLDKLIEKVEVLIKQVEDDRNF